MERKSYREAIGERLKEFRESRGLTAYKVAQTGGIRIDQVKAIESGDYNYTIDSFIGYVIGCDLYMYFSEKSESREMPHDFGDIAQKGIENIPKV